MLVSSPIVRVGQPLGRPILTEFEEFIQLLHELFLPSEEIDQTLGVMRNFESIVPGISFGVIFGKAVDSLSSGYFEEGTILISGIKEFSFGVPNIFVEFRSVQEIILGVGQIENASYLTDSEIVGAELESLAH